MKKQIIPVAQPTASPAIAPHQKSSFKGYTIEELKVQRALTDVRRQYVKEKLQQDFSRLTTNPLGEGSSRSSLAWTIGGKVLNLLSYTDYISLGIGIFNGSRKLLSLVRRKK